MARLCNAGSDAASQGTNSPKGKKILSMLQLGIHNVPSISRSDTATDEELNPHLNERFGRRAAFQDPKPPIQPTYSMTLALDIRKYAKKLEAVTNASSPAAWHGISEFPKWSEVFDPGRRAHNEDVELDSNTIVGPFSSKEDYLARHYNLLREDAVAPLRDVVSECQIYPHMSERTSRNDAYVYDKTFINGFTFTTSGLAARLTFSLGRVGKKIRWEQSKRLRTGTLVALTPANAPFKSIVRVAVVAARPISGLEENPPTIDVFFTMPEEIEIDPQQEWVMVESRNGFFEGHRHMLRGLQMLANEAFPLSNHIVNIERNILPPRYRTLRPTMDCSSIFTTLTTDEKKNVDVTQDLPSWPSLLDSTQLQALQRILGKRLSIVQGPPGTGKTFVSVVAIRLMLENRKPNDPPIIVSSHTNHALDQLLRHIAEFEPEFVRIGGMSTDLEVVRPRTLYEIKQAVNFQDPKGCLRAPALKELRQLTKEMKSLLSSLMAGDKLPSAESFEQHGVISAKQRESLVKGAQQWFDCDSNAQDVLDYWLGDQKIETKLRIAPEDFGLELEEVDLEIEQIREIEAEQRTLDDEDPEILRGEWVQLNEKWTGLKVPGVSMTNMTSEMKRQDMYDIPEALRGPLYRHMQMKLKGTIRDRLRNKAKRYASLVQEAKVGRMEVDYNFIKDAKILGLTTSGLAKYRPLLQSLKPKVVLIEEAAETLESYISISCFESLEHLILVGDHEQLRGHCHVQDLELEPFYLGISMFERLVRNSLDYTQLQSQRRMIPEIRRALTPVYPDLRDHDSVYNRPPVPGMAADTFFFSHSAPESADEQMSKMNLTEAELVVSFFVYLVQNGIAPLKITVLTFYNGQRKLLLRKLKAHPELTGQYFKVVTVDSYQGEEAEIVLLSLVRSNVSRNIGFLNVENRVVVALSRAQRGFYIFGDGPIVCKSSTLWWQVLQIMAQDPPRVGFHLPLQCVHHGNPIYFKTAEDFEKSDGGCEVPCNKMLECGHLCPRRCHASHEALGCKHPCKRTLSCGCQCQQLCYQDCKASCDCKAANKSASKLPLRYLKASSREETPLEQLDEENAARLFGEADAAVGTDNMKLVRRRDDGEGGIREVWKGTYTVRVNDGKRADASLLD